MLDLDWTTLAPHMPVDDVDSLYVQRPNDGAERLAAIIQRSSGPIAVVGPTGCGKSTELRMATELLDSSFPAAFCGIDHTLSLKSQAHVRVNSTLMLNMSIWALAYTRWDKLSPEFRKKLTDAGFNEKGVPLTSANEMPEDLLRETIREVHQASGKQPVLLVDGLEKCAPDEARQVVDVLLRYRTDVILVVVLPTELVTGPASYDIVSSFKLFPIRPVAVMDEPGAAWQMGRAFLKDIVFRRLTLSMPGPEDLDAVLDRAALLSGGIPRAFLQLMMDAALYGRLANRELPTLEDLQEAAGDHVESLRRLLNKGDIAALREADGTEGLEVEPERRLRFLSHGLLLEYKLADRIVVHPAPLLAGTLSRGERP